MEMISIPKSEYEALKGLVVALTEKIKELEAKLNKNSKNSNKPPSSDGPNKATVKNSRVKSDKPSGGQPGHVGVTKPLTSAPDTIVKLEPITECDKCKGEVIIQDENFTVRQVSDIIPTTVMTVEYRAHAGTCETCGKEHKASFPIGVEGTVCYGENIQAMVTYLTTYQLIPLKRATELIKDLFGLKISQGTIVRSSQEAYESLAETENQIKGEIVQSDVAHFDESGMRVGGSNYWLHSASTETSTVYSIHPKRGKDAMNEIGILPIFTGTAIHDHWRSYYKYDQCAHAECNEHHLRTLKYLHENLDQDWAVEMVCLLLRIKRHVDLTRLFAADIESLSIEDIAIYEGLYRDILSKAQNQVQATQVQSQLRDQFQPQSHPQSQPQSHPQETQVSIPVESKRMINRMTKYEQETLLFMYDFTVPFTNNLAERDIRMPKAKQKISGGFRSKDGADSFARIRGFVSTARKRGKNVFDGLVAVFKGDASNFLFSKG